MLRVPWYICKNGAFNSVFKSFDYSSGYQLFFHRLAAVFFREATGDFRGSISDFLTSFSDYDETIKVGMITNFSLPIQTSLFVFLTTVL